ncbi:MAG: hypothetical protein JNM56_34810 [Planctomycetia bacterium]|nr:hypothetical protein [Planctomycetia bacterium]
MDQVVATSAHQAWQEQFNAVAAEQGPDWEAQYKPGSFGCHELLDRVKLLGDLLEAQVLEHPACVLREEWYQSAARAVEALRELYQRVGEAHLAEGGPAETGNGN